MLSLAALGCADEPDPVDEELTSALTSTIPASDTCNQGVGASRCVQAPPFDVTTTAPWVIDGSRGSKEYAGAVTLPFMTDAVPAVGGPRLQAYAKVYLQRVTLRPPLAIPQHFLYVFLEDIHVAMSGSTPLANINLTLDNDRFNSPDNNVHAEDRRYRMNLSTGTTVTIEQPSGSGSGTTWSAAPASNVLFAAGGCTVINVRAAKCKGELRIPLATTAVQRPASGLAPGVGVMVRTASLVGMSPDLPIAFYPSSDFQISRFQTVLFTRPRGFDLSITSWNVRRFESAFQSPAFDAVDPNDIGQFLALHDIVAIQEGWDRVQVTKIFDAANLVRAGASLPPYNLYGPIDHQPAMSEVTESIVEGFSDTQGGLWVMSHLPLANKGSHVFSSDSCRGEDCFKAKGVQWVRLMLQDPATFDPKCLTAVLGCNKPPAGDDFIDVFNTHLQANDPLLCRTDSDWVAMKAGLIALLASLVDPGLAIQVAAMLELVENDLNCDSQTDRQARARQLDEMNDFIESVAAKDRSSLILGDFNINGKLIAGSEYEESLAALEITHPADPTDDTVSALPPGGFDIRHGDVVRERTDVDFSTGRCIGTFIDETKGTQDASCTFAGGTDADERLDYILVRPPEPIKSWAGYPRWFISAVAGSPIWTSPFPSLSGSYSATPLRLSDHKPITSTLSLARLDNPPKYNSSWPHTIVQRVISVDATSVEDCPTCGEVDPFARLVSTILPASTTSIIDPTTECTSNQNPVFSDQNPCMYNWARTRPHTPPTETAVKLFAKVWDDDDTSANDLISEGTTSQWNYGAATFEMSYLILGVPVPLPAWPNFEATKISRCAGLDVDVCHSLDVIELAP
ncbi:MAG: endonuclease/exonuclease/phosphatase family protein [Kofleriaceae bacterium]